jgi:hypothetical protein
MTSTGRLQASFPSGINHHSNTSVFSKIESRVQEPGIWTPATASSVSTSGSTSPDLIQSYPNRGVTEYLTQLLRDQATLIAYRPQFVLHHAERLLGEEIEKMRSKLLETTLAGLTPPRLELPERVGEVQTLTRKVFFPKKEFPDFNFTGRILGPQGSTIKRLEKEIGPGCLLAIRGKGSDPKNDAIRPSLEEQHVLVTIKETPNRINLVLDYALKKINPFLHPVDEEKDELKRSQMIELALIKGNYRESAVSRQLTEQLRMLLAVGAYPQLQNSQAFPHHPSPTSSNGFGFGMPTFPYVGGR